MSKGRILLTGITSQHIGKDPRLNYDHLTKMYARALAIYGYEVEHRQVIPEEDLTLYDAVMVGLGPVNGTATRYTYGAFDAIARARRSGAALLFYCDDWQVQLILSAIGTMVRGPERFVKDFLKGARVDWEWARENHDHLMTVIHAMWERPWPTTILPIYEGGDLEKLKQRGKVKVPSSNIVKVDPSPYGAWYDISVPPDEQKWGAWVLGTLSDQRAWTDSLGLSWPLAYHGSRPSKSERGAIPEPELVQMYANSWGVLSPPYWHAGSGWWRLRHQHAMQARSILLCGDGELDFMGEPFQITARDVEGRSVPQLRELADAQAEVFYKQMWSREQFETSLGQTLDNEIAKMKS